MSYGSYSLLGKKNKPNKQNKPKKDDNKPKNEEIELPLESLLGSQQDVFGEENDYTVNEYYLYSDITVNSVMGLLKFIKNAEKRWENFKLENKDILDIDTAKPTPLKIYINSNGGEIFGAIPLVDAIQKCKIPIYTYIEGIAASAASLIAMAGHKRFITTNSFMLIHELRSGVEGTFSNIMDEHVNCMKLMKVIRTVYINRILKASKDNSIDVNDFNFPDIHNDKFNKISENKTDITDNMDEENIETVIVKKVNLLLENILKRDLILSSDECKRYLLVDEIL
jgi:ATP-dependent protease ClpP protease subunit